MIQEIPEELQYYFLESVWKDYFRYKMEDMKMNSFGWNGEDKNLKAFNSKEEYIDWYCFHPKTPEPYRDFGFYIRELTALSYFIKPKVIVELGTSLGAGSFLLHHLNPEAKLYSVDNKHRQMMSDDVSYKIGVLAMLNDIPCKFIRGNSYETKIPEKFNLCFIDGDHSAEGVYQDSVWAWENKDPDNYVIIWHDCREDNPEFEGLIKSVNTFSKYVDIPIYKLQDSATAWCYKRSE